MRALVTLHVTAAVPFRIGWPLLYLCLLCIWTGNNYFVNVMESIGSVA